MHTSGPFETVNCAGGDIVIYGQENENKPIALVYHHNDKKDHDAALIAASPDMLAALEFITDNIIPSDNDNEITCKCYHLACNAIAKAKEI